MFSRCCALQNKSRQFRRDQPKESTQKLMSNLIVGTLSAVGASAAVFPRADLCFREFNISLWGTFSATIAVQRSFDGGVTWLPLTLAGVATAQYTAPCSEMIGNPEMGVAYRVACTSFSSGTINYRISQ
jgi:hypothetical protein